MMTNRPFRIMGDNKLCNLDFSRAYEISFNAPTLNTDSFFDIWIELELALAGPMYNIYTEGQCDYVFTGEHSYFTNIKTNEDFKSWCFDVIEKSKAKIKTTETFNSQENLDKQIMLKKTEKMKQTVLLGLEIIKTEKS